MAHLTVSLYSELPQPAEWLKLRSLLVLLEGEGGSDEFFCTVSLD